MLPRVLETKLNCEGQVCQVVAARKQAATPPSGLSSRILGIVVSRRFCEMGRSDRSRDAGQTENFIFSGSAYGSSGLLNMWQMPLADFEQRFQQAFNTFWYASATDMFWGGDYPSYSRRSDIIQTLAVVTTNLGPHYVCHWEWFGLAVAVVFLLEGLAIANTVLRFRTRAPDIFGYCEAKGLEQSSALDGLQRAKVLGHIRFQLVDVKGGEDIGRIAFVPRLSGESSERGGQDELGGSRVKFNRYYD
ncbi:hypothetical protein ColLi_07568 [Colletotrichum liriopes]|uniref:Uncharacterized protein n=1 Tax=Colletotrichum liriopes TaxID=708192 RepID=A0AA37LTF5_9PEZI|nr:hypothetical protein ColLi_07568 [Colletotrichum liriopes]